MSRNTRNNRCPDCGVLPGKLHLVGCDIEMCPECGTQMISESCNCKGNYPRLPWTGELPTVIACREFGWFCKYNAAQGYVPCAADDPEAMEDLNRVYAEAVWDPNLKRFVKNDTPYAFQK